MLYEVNFGKMYLHLQYTHAHTRAYAQAQHVRAHTQIHARKIQAYNIYMF